MAVSMRRLTFGRMLLICAMLTVPSWVKRMKMPIRNPKSPMRLTMNALRPAEAFYSSVNQKPINR